MQRLAGDFLVKQVVMLYDPTNGNIMELYELPNGQWQFGKGRDATVVTSLEQVETLDEGTKAQVAAWLERMKARPPAVAMQQGQTPMLAGDTSRDRLSRAITKMSNEVVDRLLNSIEQVLGPIADSLTQGDAINSHEDGYGQDQHMHAPGPVAYEPFQLPHGARWADARNPASGYLTSDSGVTDEKGNPTVAWHPTPEFHALTAQPDPTPIAETTPLKVHDPVQEEMERDRAMAVGEPTSSRRRR